MPRIVAYEFMSLDGCFSGPTGSEMDFVTGGFSTEMEEDIARQYESVDAFIMGRTTFDSLAGYWPTPAASNERLVEPMNRIPKLVVSSSSDVSAWSNSEHLLDPVADLKARDGNGDLMVIGSASVVALLAQYELIDEYRFLLFPIVLGDGRPLFSRSEPISGMALTRLHAFDTGVVAADYAIAQ
jgi:dihydrofolate reductase